MIYHEIFTVDNPSLPFFFSCQLVPPWSPDREVRGNWHDELEILYFLDGMATINSGDEHFEAHSGDLVVFNSNDIHKIMPIDNYARYMCLIINSSYCMDNYIDLGNTRLRGILQDEIISKLMTELGECYPADISPESIDKAIPARILMSRSIVLQILTRLVCCYQTNNDHSHNNNRNNNDKIKNLLEHIHSNLQRDISLDEISCLSGLSKYYLSREFKRVTGLPFVRYVNFIRCENAKQLLKDQKTPIGEICKRCGFSDLSYFSKTFLRIVGITPTEYRKKNAHQLTK